MVLTNQNKNPDLFGETRTFTVPAQSKGNQKTAGPIHPNHTGTVNGAADVPLKRPVQQRPQQERPVQQRPQQERPMQQRPQQERPMQQRPQQERPMQQRPQQERPMQQRPQQERPMQQRLQQERPMQQRLQQERPVQQRLQQERPMQQRSQQERPVQQRLQQERPVQQKKSAEHLSPLQKIGADLKQKKTTDVKTVRDTKKEKELQKQLSKTRTTDLGFNRAAETEQKQEKQTRTTRKAQSGGDEGNNTIISIVKAVIYIVFVFVVSIFLAIALISVGNDVFAFVKSDEEVEVTIPEYATLDDVTDILYMNDIIKYPKVFKMYAVFRKDNQEYLAGTYTVNGMMNYDKLLAEFKEKPVTGTIRLTIPEGYTVNEIIDLFVSHGMGTKEGFVDVLENGEFDYWFVRELEEKGIPEGRTYRLEGYLFPDTYEFYLNSSEETIVKKMLKRFGQIFTKEYRQQCELLGYSVDEIVTLASMIEKEAGNPSQFFLVSSVFHNRLSRPAEFTKLDSDATIVYAIQCETGERVSLTSEDLFYDTPYNTYQNNGLPPGPIANPSASALLAALSPQKSDYYFFVSDGGNTYFSETKAEHDALIAGFKSKTSVQTTGDVPSVNNP